MVKPLTFKGDKKPKKRKHREGEGEIDNQISSITARTEAASALTPEASHRRAEEELPDDQSWVSADVLTDIGGPIVFVLPSSPPACIASDVNGKVFASELENMIEADPQTAEPHDVRQVWVATKVAGSEGFGFKGHHGKYLSCDKYGILSATASAISSFESFLAIQSPDTPSMFSLQTRDGETETFLTVKQSGVVAKGGSTSVEIRGDAPSISFDTTIRIRMQARFKPRLKANKENKAREKISRRELEEAVGRRLEEHEVKRLKKARREGNFHEEVLDVRVKGKHDKFAS